MVEEAGQEEGGARGRRHLVLEHGGQHGTGVPHVDEVHGLALDDGDEQGAEQADGVAHGRPDERRRPFARRRQLAGLGHDRAVGVDHPLGVGGGARRPGHEGGRRGIHRRRRAHRVVVEQCRERRPAPGVVAGDVDTLEGRELVDEGVQRREVVDGPEVVGGHEHLGAGSVEDVADLFGAVEVHDRHHHRSEEAGAVEEQRRLDPVGQLEGDHVAGTDPGAGQPGGRPPAAVEHVAECSRPGPHV